MTACFLFLPFTVVEIERIDLACEENNTNHHTLLNGVDRLIVRRGQPFTITLHLKPGTHFQNGADINFIAKTGSSITSRLYNKHTTTYLKHLAPKQPNIMSCDMSETNHFQCNKVEQTLNVRQMSAAATNDSAESEAQVKVKP